MTFDISRRHGEAAEAALGSLEADLALIFEPIRSGDFQTIATTRQAVYCCMAETHDLARLDTIRLHHLIDIPVIMPTNGVRQLLNVGLMRRNINLARMLETDSEEFTQSYLQNEMVIGFQIPIGLAKYMAEGRSVDGLISRPLDTQDVPQGTLHIGHLRGRVLPVAAKFMDLIITELRSDFQKILINSLDCPAWSNCIIKPLTAAFNHVVVLSWK